MAEDRVTFARKIGSYVNEHLRTASSDGSFDDFVNLAAKLYKAPFALIAFVDETDCWFKAQRGLHMKTIDRTGHLLARTIDSAAPLTVADIMEDADAISSPLVIAGARFFAAAPLLAPDEPPIGVLAVMDSTP